MNEKQDIKNQEIMINRNIEDAKVRLEKMDLEEGIVDNLLSFKEGEDFLFDSAFKITGISQADFTEKVKDQLSEEQAGEVYQKALDRRAFVSEYIENAREMTEPHYRALRICNIDHDTAAECDAIINSLQEGE